MCLKVEKAVGDKQVTYLAWIISWMLCYIFFRFWREGEWKTYFVTSLPCTLTTSSKVFEDLILIIHRLQHFVVPVSNLAAPSLRTRRVTPRVTFELTKGHRCTRRVFTRCMSFSTGLLSVIGHICYYYIFGVDTKVCVKIPQWYVSIGWLEEQGRKGKVV